MLQNMREGLDNPSHEACVPSLREVFDEGVRVIEESTAGSLPRGGPSRRVLATSITINPATCAC